MRVCVCVRASIDNIYNAMRYIYICIRQGRGSSVGIATRYELDGLGSNAGGGGDFSYRSCPALGLTQPPIQ